MRFGILLLMFMGIAPNSVASEITPRSTIQEWTTWEVGQKLDYIGTYLEVFSTGHFWGTISFCMVLIYEDDLLIENNLTIEECNDLRPSFGRNTWIPCLYGKTFGQHMAQFDLWATNHPEEWHQDLAAFFMKISTNETNCPDEFRKNWREDRKK